jgi:hypothetical protein
VTLITEICDPRHAITSSLAGQSRWNYRKG